MTKGEPLVESMSYDGFLEWSCVVNDVSGGVGGGFIGSCCT